MTTTDSQQDTVMQAVRSVVQNALESGISPEVLMKRVEDIVYYWNEDMARCANCGAYYADTRGHNPGCCIFRE